MIKKTLLVVDDEPGNLALIDRTLKDEKYRLVFAKSGQQAIEVAEREQPDLVLLDIMMPEMDGFAVLDHWKKTGRLSSLRVIVLTALSDTESLLKALRAGAVDYVQKPFNSEELIARIKNHVQLISAEQSLQVMDNVLEGTRWWIIEPLRSILSQVKGTSHERDVEHSLRQVTKRIGQGRLYLKLQNKRFDMQPINLRDMLAELLKDKEWSTHFKGGVLDRFEGNTWVLADKQYLFEVFRVLRDNAQKRSNREGKIKVELSGGEDVGQAVIGFADKGTPIPSQERPLVFSLFPEGKATGSKGRTTNLALALAKTIVDGHDGEISCESINDMTHFVVRLPVMRRG